MPKNKPALPSDELAPGETHPSANHALSYLKQHYSRNDMVLWQEALSSVALDTANRGAALCAGTLRRLLAGEPVSDRYLMGLVLFLRSSEDLLSGKMTVPKKKSSKKPKIKP